MKKSQLSKDINQRFEEEKNRLVEETTEENKKGKYLRIFISMVMSMIVLASLLYNLITSLK